MCVFISVIFSSPVYCIKVITDSLIVTGDDNGCVKVNNFDICKIFEKTYSYNRFSFSYLTFFQIVSCFNSHCSLFLGSRDGAVVRALASHQRGPGSIPAWCHKWVAFVVGSRLAPRVFLQVLRLSSLHRSQHLQIPI